MKKILERNFKDYEICKSLIKENSIEKQYFLYSKPQVQKKFEDYASQHQDISEAEDYKTLKEQLEKAKKNFSRSETLDEERNIFYNQLSKNIKLGEVNIIDQNLDLFETKLSRIFSDKSKDFKSKVEELKT